MSTVWTFELVKDQLHLLDTQIAELRQKRAEVAKNCMHDKIERSDEHYYCMGCGDCVGDAEFTGVGEPYEGTKTWTGADGETFEMTYQDINPRVILNSDPRIVREKDGGFTNGVRNDWVYREQG